jgi:hypothetical protein
MHPSGALAAYEWSFDDLNPPVHAWSCWRVYQITAKATGKKDTVFLERCFMKLLVSIVLARRRCEETKRAVGSLRLESLPSDHVTEYVLHPSR